jgi:hypothetical protein
VVVELGQRELELPAGEFVRDNLADPVKRRTMAAMMAAV